MLLSAPHIIPIEGPTYSPGVIRIQGDTISDIGNASLLQKYSGEKIVSLDSMVLFPGFVNAHCHLDLTTLGPLKPKEFTAWIRDVVSQKNATQPEQVEKGITSGIQTLIKSGVTTIGDHIGFNTDPSPILNSPLKGILFGEVLGLLPEVAEDIYGTFKKMDSYFHGHDRFVLHISPHSVHAVNPETLKKVILENKAPLSCHLAESEPEEKYFSGHKGTLATFVRERGLAIPHRGRSAFDFLNQQQVDISKLLVIHGNYLTDKELDLIAEKKMSIVHCPGSHSFFGHSPFPLQKCLDRGINVALGTDSIASNTTLHFLDELKKLKKSFPWIEAKLILEMATLGGAKALRMENEIGSLIAGKKADICGFKCKEKNDLFDIPLKALQADFLMANGKVLQLPA